MTDMDNARMSDNRPFTNIRDRIAAVLLPDLEYASAYNPVEDPEVWAHRLADAVIRDVLTPEFLADLMIAAVQKAADDE
jgi:hypothetical protein